MANNSCLASPKIALKDFWYNIQYVSKISKCHVLSLEEKKWPEWNNDCFEEIIGLLNGKP